MIHLRSGRPGARLLSRRAVVGGMAALAPLGLIGSRPVLARGTPAAPPARLFAVADFGAKGDFDRFTRRGADDTRAIQAAIDAAHRAGGGLVVFDADATYRVRGPGPTGPDVMGGPAIRLRPGVSLDGRGCHLFVAEKSVVIGNAPGLSRHAQITADVAAADTGVSVDRPDLFRRGQRVFLRLGENGHQPIEPRLARIATVTGVAGDRVTLDRAVGVSVAVESATAPNRRLHVIDELIDGVDVRNFHFHSPRNISPESGLHLVVARAVTVRNLWAHGNIGAGLINFQFVEGARCRDIFVLRNDNPLDHSAMGRAVTLSNVEDCLIEGLAARELTGIAVFVESHSKNVRFRGVDITYGGPWRPRPIVFHTTEESDVVYENVFLRATESVIVQDSGAAPVSVRFRNLTLSSPRYPTALPSTGVLSGRLRLIVDGREYAYDLSKVEVIERRVPLLANRSISVDDFPAGLILRYETWLPADLPAGLLREAWLGAGPRNGVQITHDFAPGRHVVVEPRQGIGTHNNPYATPELLTTPRRLLLVTGEAPDGPGPLAEARFRLHLVPRQEA